MDFNHDGHKGNVQQHFDKTCEELGVQHIDGLVVPGVLALEVHSVQHILNEGGEDHRHQDGVLKPKDELH